ncbi:hypothetical protein M2271_005767 [Streptomyces sp. LBL]|uniref:hypothetical protein n=1 Tax=Streptomyces sp. LBL TaxID=2940562 RepID=UPI00247606E9|nr:hypothetical protein [Streptomyces sp. LBL]MDH6627938.1 hypothetical protein [Streptomyces sp. LBL]
MNPRTTPKTAITTTAATSAVTTTAAITTAPRPTATTARAITATAAIPTATATAATATTAIRTATAATVITPAAPAALLSEPVLERRGSLLLAADDGQQVHPNRPAALGRRGFPGPAFTDTDVPRSPHPATAHCTPVPTPVPAHPTPRAIRVRRNPR